MNTDYIDPIFLGESPTDDVRLYDTIDYYRNLAFSPVGQLAAQDIQPFSIAAPYALPQPAQSGLYGLLQYLPPPINTRQATQDFLPILESGRTYTEPERYVRPTTAAPSSPERAFRSFEPFSPVDISRAQFVNFPTGPAPAPTTPANLPIGDSGIGAIDIGGGGGGGDFGGESSVGPGPSASDVGNAVASAVHSANQSYSGPLGVVATIANPVGALAAKGVHAAMMSGYPTAVPAPISTVDPSNVTDVSAVNAAAAQAAAVAEAAEAAAAAAQAADAQAAENAGQAAAVAAAEAAAAQAAAEAFGNLGNVDAGAGPAGPSGSTGTEGFGAAADSVGGGGASGDSGAGAGAGVGGGAAGDGSAGNDSDGGVGSSTGAGPSDGGASVGESSGAAADGSDSGGGGGGGGGKIICTKLYQLGLLSEDIYLADQAFGADLVKTNPDIYNGYRAWAEIVVDWMSGSGPNMMPWLSEKRRREVSQNWSTSWAKEIATPWAEEMAFKMGVKESGNTTGKLITAAGMPICKVVGVWQRVFGPSKKPAGFCKGALLIPVFVLFKIVVKFGRLIEGKKAPSL